MPKRLYELLPVSYDSTEAEDEAKPWQRKLSNEQKEAFQKLMENQTGILSASTAFGKTIANCLQTNG